MALRHWLLDSEEKKAIKEQENFEKVKEIAINSEDVYVDPKNEEGIKIEPSKDIRQAYFDVFESLVKPQSKYHDASQFNPLFFGNNHMLPFYGIDQRGSLFNLYFTNQSANLEISSYSFNNQDHPQIAEIGLLSTYKNKDGNYQTDLKVGESFEFDSGYKANHSISNTIRKFQDDNRIPNIPRKTLENIPGISRSNLMNEKRDIADK